SISFVPLLERRRKRIAGRSRASRVARKRKVLACFRIVGILANLSSIFGTRLRKSCRDTVETFHVSATTGRNAAMNTTLDLNSLLLFYQVVNAQSITRAAQQLRLPKSTISRKLTLLERQL